MDLDKDNEFLNKLFIKHGLLWGNYKLFSAQRILAIRKCYKSAIFFTSRKFFKT